MNICDDCGQFAATAIIAFSGGTDLYLVQCALCGQNMTISMLGPEYYCPNCKKQQTPAPGEP